MNARSVLRACMVLALLMIGICVIALPAKARGGHCGDNLTWELTEDGILTISGTGAMSDYTIKLFNNTSSPWSLSMGTFAKCDELRKVDISDVEA